MVDVSPSPPPKQTTMHKFISFGFRCSSAGILKKMGIKNESLPFDWLVSRLNVITHCIGDNNFCDFLKISNYEKRHTNTFARTYNTENFICDEYIFANKYYQPYNTLHTNITYHYNLAMNHYNITEHLEYFERCIGRWRDIITSTIPHLITYLHISPVFYIENAVDFDLKKNNLINEITNLNNILLSYTQQNANVTFSGLIFLLVDENSDNKAVFAEINLQNNTLIHTEIYKIRVNKDFIDAGEIFMGNYENELNIIETIIREHISKKVGNQGSPTNPPFKFV